MNLFDFRFLDRLCTRRGVLGVVVWVWIESDVDSDVVGRFVPG